MELVMLKEIDRSNLLESEVQKRQEQQKKGMEHKIEIYDPSPTEGVVDVVISEKLSELKRAEIEKIKTEEAETGKFKNAWAFSDIYATVKKAGFHSDGSPKIAIAGLFDKEVQFKTEGKKAVYCSERIFSGKMVENFSVEFESGEVKTNWKNKIRFFVGFAAVVASLVISIIAISASESNFGYYDISLLACGLIPFFAFLFASGFILDDGNYFTYLELPNIGKVRTRSYFYTDVPSVPESVLTKISGHGPFAILFEVTEGWRKAEPDPVILRIITIGDKQFFEPVVGYDMTPLEKSSLVPA